MSHRMSRRTILATLAALSAGAAWPALAAYPEKTIRMVVPYPPGTGTDTLARYTAERLEAALGKSVVVENRVGGNAFIAAQAVAGAAPDGHTLLLAPNSPVTTNVASFAKLPYDPVKDFEPVARLAFAPMVLVVPAASRFKTIQDLIDAARARPGALNYGSGSPTYRIATEWMLSLGGLQAAHIAYKGAAPALVDLAGGNLDFVIAEYSGTLPYISGGRLRPLAVTTPERLPSMPEVPTLQEAGFKGFTQLGWWAVFAPAKTPAPIIKTLESALASIYADARTANFLAGFNMTSFFAGAADTRKFQLEEIDRDVQVVTQAKIPRQ